VELGSSRHGRGSDAVAVPRGPSREYIRARPSFYSSPHIAKRNGKLRAHLDPVGVAIHDIGTDEARD